MVETKGPYQIDCIILKFNTLISETGPSSGHGMFALLGTIYNIGTYLHISLVFGTSSVSLISI